MGTMQIPEVQQTVKNLLEQGYYRFVAMFTWTGKDDEVALERLKPFVGHQILSQMDIDPDTYQTYYLTGARTQLCIGYTKSAAGLRKFHSSVCFGTGIEAEFYHAVEGWESVQAAKAAKKSGS